MKVVRVDVNPYMLKWARKKSGFKKYMLSKDIQKNISKWESGELKPTWNQLRELGKIYKRPSAFFLLYEPPKELEEDIIDYRNHEDSERSPELQIEIRRCSYRRDNFLDILEKTGFPIPKFSTIIHEHGNYKKLAFFIRQILGIPIEEQLSWKNDPKSEALNNWKFAIENLNVLVFESQKVEKKETWGFCLSKDKFPVICLNGKIKFNGRVFTLIHELVHLFLRNSALCDLKNTHNIRYSDEVFCNNVTGEILVPEFNLKEEIKCLNRENGKEWDDNDLNKLAKRFSVSKEVILVRLLKINKTTEEFYLIKKKQWNKLYDNHEDGSSGGNYFRNLLKYNGNLYTKTLISAYRNDLIASNEFSDYMGGIRTNYANVLENLLENAGVL